MNPEVMPSGHSRSAEVSAEREEAAEVAVADRVDHTEAVGMLGCMAVVDIAVQAVGTAAVDRADHTGVADTAAVPGAPGCNNSHSGCRPLCAPPHCSWWGSIPSEVLQVQEAIRPRS